MSSCPVRNLHYGGLPSSGGFSPYREFGVGLANAFEAAHCVLGSLGRHLGKDKDDWSAMIRTEAGHLKEEVGIIRGILREYSRPLYRERMMLSDLEDYFPDARERVKESTALQVEDIRESSAKLISTVRVLGRQFAENLRDSGAPAPWANLAGATYLFVKALAEAAEASVADWPDAVGDPYSDPMVRKRFRQMEKHLQALLAWKPSEVRVARRYAFVSNPIIYLKQYLTQEDWEKGAEVALDNEDHFLEWLEENANLVEDEPDLQQVIEDGYVDDAWSLPKDVLEWYFKDIAHSLRGESWSPSWLFMDYVKVMKNQWMIHFTNDADGVACDGFRYGMDDLTRLGLTTHFTSAAKPGGYNFAYDVDEWERYARGRHGFKYGDEAVLFRASGIKVWHHSDGEYQVIFVGDTAKDIVPLTKGGYDGGWWANGIGKGGREEQDSEQGDGSFDSLSEAVDWVTANYNQYKRLLTC
jgi:hypothetical protein